MGTNFYRIPSVKDVEERKNKLQTKIRKIDLSPSSINRNFNIGGGPDEWTNWSPWDEFTDNILIHLGKRSMGWKFCWNFHDKKFYTSKEELFDFIRSGRIIDEYGEEINQEEFIEMALDWCKDGWDTQTYYEENPSSRVSWFDSSRYHDIYIDDLRISTSTDFS
jgi:hypothetical protein